MSKINKYIEFITESKLELLLEARIEYSNEFNAILYRINSPISKYLIDLEYKEVDVNTNYIDIIRVKDDVVYFKPDDKITNLYKVRTRGYYDLLSIELEKGDKYNIKNVKEPAIGQVGKIIHILELEELIEFSPKSTKIWEYMYLRGTKIVHFKWDNGEMLIDMTALDAKTPESVTNSEIKIGRLVNLLLKKAGIDVTGKQIEEFVDKYKAEIQIMKNAFNRFEIVKGEAIRKCYLYENYESQNGTLGGSCMKDEKCQHYLDIYTKNPENISLIILNSDKDKDKISGRAILWTDIDGKKFMDRIYVNNSPDTTLFIEFAIKNNFYYKSTQDSKETTVFKLDGVDSIFPIVIQLTNISHHSYPYMDTLKYYYYKKGILTNKKSFGDIFYFLIGVTGNIDGQCEFCGGEGTVDCPECDGRDRNCYFCNGQSLVDCPECS